MGRASFFNPNRPEQTSPWYHPLELILRSDLTVLRNRIMSSGIKRVQMRRVMLGKDLMSAASVLNDQSQPNPKR